MCRLPGSKLPIFPFSFSGLRRTQCLETASRRRLRPACPTVEMRTHSHHWGQTESLASPETMKVETAKGALIAAAFAPRSHLRADFHITSAPMGLAHQLRCQQAFKWQIRWLRLVRRTRM